MMAKLAVFFFAVAAAQAAFTGLSYDHQRQDHQLQHLLQRIQQVTRDITNDMQNFQVETSQGRRSLAHHANDFAYNMQKVVYYMQQIYNENQLGYQGEWQKNLKQIAGRLSEVAYTVQQAMNTDGHRMKEQLRSELRTGAEQMEKLLQVVQEMQGDQSDFKQQIKEVLFYYLSAVQKLRSHIHHHHESVQEIYAQVQQAANQAVNAVHNLGGSDEQTAEDVSCQTQQLAHKLNHMVHKLQHWINNHHHHHHDHHDQHDQHDNQDLDFYRKQQQQQYHQQLYSQQQYHQQQYSQQQQQQQQGGEQQAKMYMQQVVNQMSEIHAHLQQVAASQGLPEGRINDMKRQLVDAVQEVASCMQKMMQVGQTTMMYGQQDGHSASHVAKDVLVDFLAACHNMKTEMEIMGQRQQYNY